MRTEIKNELVAIHESKYSEKVVRFIPLDSFTAAFIKKYNNNDIDGCYYDENGSLVSLDTDGQERPLPLKFK